MLFHVGALWRLNELGWLPKLDRVSSVSGGSITAGVLAHRWSQLAFDGERRRRGFEQAIVAPIRKLAGKTIDVSAGLKGIFLPGSIASFVARRYDREHSSAERRSSPCPTGRASSSTRRTCSRASSGDSRSRTCGTTGSARSHNPTEKLSTAVAASSAFPPFLSPMKLKLSPGDYEPGTRHRSRAGGVPAPPGPQRRRCLRQPRARDGLEALPDGPRQRRRRPLRSPKERVPHELGAPGDARDRRDRQPGEGSPQASGRRRLRRRAPRGCLLEHLEPRRRLRPRRRAPGRRRRGDGARPTPTRLAKLESAITRSG